MSSSAAKENDTVGGGVLISSATSVFVNGKLIGRLNDSITPHSTGPHLSAKMIESSSTVFAEGLGVSRDSDSASCSDLLESDSNVKVG